MRRESLDAGERWPLSCGMPDLIVVSFRTLTVRRVRGGHGSATSGAAADCRLDRPPDAAAPEPSRC
jgi:hypothetical protein